MATEAQILANRPNAQESDSPRNAPMEKSTMNTGAPADYFMQNKANLLDAQMNVSSILSKYYENVPLRRRGENKPKQSRGIGNELKSPIFPKLTKC